MITHRISTIWTNSKEAGINKVNAKKEQNEIIQRRNAKEKIVAFNNSKIFKNGKKKIWL